MCNFQGIKNSLKKVDKLYGIMYNKNVIIGDELAFLCKVGSLLGQHIAECIVSATGDAACRMVHLRATVAHVISGSHHVASVSVTRTRRCMSKYGKCFKDVKGNYPLISPAKF